MFEKVKSRYNEYKEGKVEEKKRLAPIIEETRQKEKERAFERKAEAIRQRPEVLRQRRAAFREKVQSGVRSITAGAKSLGQSQSGGQGQTFAGVSNNMMGSFGGGMQRSSPLDEFSPNSKKGKARKPRDPFANERPVKFGNPLAEFSPKRMKKGKKMKLRNNGGGWF